MPLPVVPARSRKSGELTFVRYVRVNDKDKGARIESFMEDSTEVGKMACRVDDTYGFTVGNEVFVIGADDVAFNGYHTITAVTPDGMPLEKDGRAASPGIITFASDWPEGLSGTISMPETCTLYNMSDFETTGQATDTSGGSSGESDTWSTLGVEDEDIATGTTYDVSMTLYVDDDLLIAGVLGQDPSQPIVELDSVNPYHVHILLETYSSRNPSQAQLLYTTVYESVKWDSWNTPNSAGKNSFGQWELSGSTRKKYMAKKR